jgi:hypothetical protein
MLDKDAQSGRVVRSRGNVPATGVVDYGSLARRSVPPRQPGAPNGLLPEKQELLLPPEQGESTEDHRR